MSEPNDGRNRRLKQRFKIRLQVVVIVERQGVRRPYAFVTRNISESGLFIFGGSDFVLNPTESLLDLTIQLDEDRTSDITMQTKVMHSNTVANGYGLRIVKIGDESARRLAAFIEEYAREHPDSLED